MEGISLGPRTQNLLETWADVITKERKGSGYDLTHPTRTEVCQSRLEVFLENPTEETFRDLWNPEALATAADWNHAMVLNLWHDDFEAIANLFSEIAKADEFHLG